MTEIHKSSKKRVEKEEAPLARRHREELRREDGLGLDSEWQTVARGKRARPKAGQTQGAEAGGHRAQDRAQDGGQLGGWCVQG